MKFHVCSKQAVVSASADLRKLEFPHPTEGYFGVNLSYSSEFMCVEDCTDVEYQLPNSTHALIYNLNLKCDPLVITGQLWKSEQPKDTSNINQNIIYVQ